MGPARPPGVRRRMGNGSAASCWSIASCLRPQPRSASRSPRRSASRRAASAHGSSAASSGARWSTSHAAGRTSTSCSWPRFPPARASSSHGSHSTTHRGCPVYATSHAWSGVPDPTNDRDLDGVVIGDMPWLVAPAEPDRALRAQLDAALEERLPEFPRLYAFGADAYRLAIGLRRITGDPACEHRWTYRTAVRRPRPPDRAPALVGALHRRTAGALRSGGRGR